MRTNNSAVVHRGLGKHIWATGNALQALEDFYFGLFVLQLCYTTAIVFVKFSILAFYRRIFRVNSIKAPLYTLWTIVGCWGIALVSSLETCLSHVETVSLYVCMLTRPVADDNIPMRSYLWLLGQNHRSEV